MNGNGRLDPAAAIVLPGRRVLPAFAAGDGVMVYDQRRTRWLPGVVTDRRVDRGAMTKPGEAIHYIYSVRGIDEHGGQRQKFQGEWQEQFVRARK